MDTNIQDTTQTTQPLTVKQEKKIDLVSRKIRENKYFFYGVPIAVVVVIFVGLLQFILPTIQYYYESRKTNKVLEENNANVNKSIGNLNEALRQEATLRSYDNALTEYVPRESKLGTVINRIQTKANDFNLQTGTIGAARGAGRTSVNNLAERNKDNKALFESIASGEISFKPQDSTSENVNAVLISIEVSIKGDREAFLRFLADLDKEKPLINLVFVEYDETTLSQDKANVSALLRFESYALNMTEDLNQNTSKKYKKDDSGLLRSIPVEKFQWNEEIGTELGVVPTLEDVN